MPEPALIGLVGMHGHDMVREGATAELQRRFMSAFRTSADRSATQTERIIQLTEETGKQTHTLIVLTGWIIALPITLGLIALVQLWVMLKGGA